MIFLLAFGAIGFGAFLVLLIARFAPHPAEHVTAAHRAQGGAVAMPFDEFRALLIDLLDALRLEVVLLTATARELDVVVRSSEPLTGGRYLMHAIWEAPGDVVDQPSVLRLQEAAKADGAAKGILITPWRILTDGIGNLETPIELVDGRALRDLVERTLAPERLSQLARYRGFGM